MINALEYLGWSALIALCLNQLGAAAIIDSWQFRVNSPSEYNLEVPNE